MNNMVISWTLHSMVPDIAQTILWCDTASEAWDDLKERSYEGDAFRITDIQEEISSIKQGGSSVWEYYTKLKLLWDEVLTLRPLTTCVCATKCSCGCLDKMKNKNQMDKVTTFLRGLNEVYAGVKSNIMLMQPLPTIGKVCSLVQQ